VECEFSISDGNEMEMLIALLALPRFHSSSVKLKEDGKQKAKKVSVLSRVWFRGMGGNCCVVGVKSAGLLFRIHSEKYTMRGKEGRQKKVKKRNK
jgi:hypothetical protein